MAHIRPRLRVGIPPGFHLSRRVLEGAEKPSLPLHPFLRVILNLLRIVVQDFSTFQNSDKELVA